MKNLSYARVVPMISIFFFFHYSFSSKLLPHLHHTHNLLIINKKRQMVVPTPMAVILQPFFA